MSAEPIEGVWSRPQTVSKALYHFFVEGDENSLCGRWRLREMGADREIRCPGGEGCQKCADIHGEICAFQPPAEPEPNWTVKTDPVEGTHTLYFQGKPQSTVRGPTGHATQIELAAIFNRNGTLPKPKKKIRCAADAPNPAKFIEKKSKHSPKLPLSESITTTAMPAKTNTTAPVDSTAHVVETAPASHFKRYANNRNISADVVEKMTASIREVGILQPLIGRVIAGDPMIEIIGGETRWLGASAIDPEFPIPYFARTLTDKEAARLHAVENFQRQDLNDVEQAREIQNMLDCGWEMQEIMSHLGKEKDYLYRRLNLLKLPEEGRTAVLEGNLSLFTASKILMLPEESRGEAIKAVTEPVHAARALPEREAIKLIQERFIDPMEKADEWEQRRDLLEKENPGCVWLKYEHAYKADDHNSEYVRADEEPDFEYLSDPARHEELVVPTWKELAKKHGSPIYIGFNRWNKEVQLYVSPVAIVEAEKSACDDNPEDCIFSHEKAVQKNRAEAEKRKLEEERQRELKFQHRLALEEEETRMVALVLAPDGLSKTTSKKLVDRAAAHNVLESYIETDDLRKIFQIERTEHFEEWGEKTEATFAKYLKNKALDPFEALGRVVIAGYLTSSYCNYTLVFESGLCKPADFPASHEEYQKELAQAAEIAAKQAASKPTKFADGEPESNREEDAA